MRLEGAFLCGSSTLRVCLGACEDSTMFGKDLGLMSEVMVTGRKVGADRNFWTALAHNENLFTRVVSFVAMILHPVFRLIPIFDFDKTAEDWELITDSKPIQGDFHPELAPSIIGRHFNEPGMFYSQHLPLGESFEEDFVWKGEEILKKAKELGLCGGQRHAEAMLRNQDIIPVEWRKYFLVFPETSWEKPASKEYPNSGTSIQLPMLEWIEKENEWQMRYYYLGSFLRKFRIIRITEQK